MKNNQKAVVTVEMTNVDHAVHLTEALRKFFKIADAGGDCSLMFWCDSERINCGAIGHDVCMPIIDIHFPDKEKS